MDATILKEALETELNRVITIINLLKALGVDYSEFNELLDTGSDLLNELRKDSKGG